FYPLQSLKKDKIHVSEIPIIIDAGDEQTLHELNILARTISDDVVEADDEKRLKLHLAAVICNNFVNYLYRLTEEFCMAENLDFQLFYPLIKETASRIENISPAKSQTGPAIRKDQETIEKHITLLHKYPELEKFYTLFTESILNRQ
ncbi:MAG TPA: DUF2520 domain-containing protein, partial [Flavisolibacter sp.]|nr:DUF2520 domain-containing protein [Flavisolibacter sp.]